MYYSCWAVKRQLNTTSITEISYLYWGQKQLNQVKNDNEYRHELRDDYDIRDTAECDLYTVKYSKMLKKHWWCHILWQ